MRRIYQSQTAGLGAHFVTSVVADIESLRIHAGARAESHGFHRLICKRFPFNTET